MVKYKVMKAFKDIHTDEAYEPNAEIEMTIKRAEEVEENLDGSFLVRVDPPDKKEK